MPTTILNAAFDGISPVANIYGGTDSFGTDRFLEYYSQYEVDANNDLVLNANLSGADWTVSSFRVGAQSGETQLNLTDLDGGTGRRIDFLKLGYESDVDLISTRVRYILGDTGDLHDLSLGSGNVDAINLAADLNVVTTGSGSIGTIDNYRGISDITVNGYVGSIFTREENDELVVDGGFVNFASLGIGNNAVTVLNDGRIANLFTQGDNTVTLLDDAKIFSLKLDFGQNTVTTEDGFLESFFSFEASNDVAIGDGGAGQIEFESSTQQSHTVVADGYIGSFQARDRGNTTDDDQTTDLTLFGGGQSVFLGGGDDIVRVGDVNVNFINTRGGNDVVNVNDGGAGSVYLSDGNDRIRTGDGHVEYISGGNGNDRFDLRGGGAGLVRGNDGKDTFYIRELNDPNFGTVIQGGSGNDTLNFTAITTTGVSFSLSGAGVFQNIGAFDPTGEEAPVIGYLSETSVEWLVGSDQNDNLEGDASSNRLFGGSGDDILAGGVGNDRLYGEGGSDTFVFATASGTDRVYGWEDGSDVLEIVGHEGGFAELDISDRGDNLLVRYDGGRFYLMDQAGVTLTDGDFNFI